MPTLPLPWLALLGLALFVAVKIALGVAKALTLRGAARAVLKDVGAKALLKTPESIKLEKLTFAPEWKDKARMDEIAGPLLAAGFADCGVLTVDRMPGVKIWFLMNESESTAAFVYEHPKAAPWVEFSVRYEDGTTTALSTLPATGINPPPFYHRIQADAATPADQLFRRLLHERPKDGIKRVTGRTVVAEFEEAYLKMMIWQKNHGLSVEEVATVAKKWLEKRAREES